VRIPIGYWAFEVGSDEPYIQGQLPYLQKAVTWASFYGLQVIVDLLVLGVAPKFSLAYTFIHADTALLEVKTGSYVHYPLVIYLTLLYDRFDNSGHRIPFPQWHSNKTNIDRTNEIIKRIATMFANDPAVVTTISPLNE
jgi:glucan 1,3-beta-glucosidase